MSKRKDEPKANHTFTNEAIHEESGADVQLRIYNVLNLWQPLSPVHILISLYSGKEHTLEASIA